MIRGGTVKKGVFSPIKHLIDDFQFNEALYVLFIDRDIKTVFDSINIITSLVSPLPYTLRPFRYRKRIKFFVF